VIVESPTKAKTIGAFLGKGFTVKSSFGHVRDLPKGKMGVDTEHDFAPSYVIPTKARKTVTELKKLAASPMKFTSPPTKTAKEKLFMAPCRSAGRRPGKTQAHHFS